jgi:hypothetical protein
MAVTIDGSSGLTTNDGSVFTDASGNVGIGTSSPTSPLHTTTGATAGAIFSRTAGDNGVSAAALNIATSLASPLIGSSGDLRFLVGAVGTASVSQPERMRVAATGEFMVGTGDIAGEGGLTAIPLGSAGSAILIFDRASTASSSNVINFRNAGTAVGRISFTNTATTYATSSDYRLKHDIQPLTGALGKVAALKPVTYKWNADGSNGEGFIAHELQAVVPECVTGEKDAVDAEGNPEYQGIDTSFLVATLTAAIQEQQAIITALTARVETLEGAQG